MPVIIQELIVRVVVDAGASPAAPPRPTDDEAAGERAALVQACVAETLKILRKAKER
jgi:hypothetical protein